MSHRCLHRFGARHILTNGVTITTIHICTLVFNTTTAAAATSATTAATHTRVNSRMQIGIDHTAKVIAQRIARAWTS